MTDAHTADDPRSDSMKIEMAQHFDEFEADYRDEDWCTVVFENDHIVVLADHKGHEFSEWADEFGDDFSETMHTLAREACDFDWSASYPVVFDKLA